MTSVKLDKFGGMLPAWDQRLLPDGQASYAQNCYLFSGSLIGWRQPKLLRQLLNSAAKFVYRITNRDSNNTIITAADSKWLEFLDPDTNVIRTPVVDDKYQRYYAASPSDVPRYNTYDRIWNDEPWWILGVPGSGCAPGVNITGGGDTVQLGFTVAGLNQYTFVPAQQITFVPVTPNGTLLIQSVSFTPSFSGTMTFRSVVYSDLDGRPFELLGIGVDTTSDQPNTVITSALENGVEVLPNTTYWVGLQTDIDYYLIMVDDSSQGMAYNATFTNPPPDFINTVDSTRTSTFQIWADLLGSSVFTGRAYVYTWVTEYGEEGPPSPPTVVNGWSNGVWDVELFTPTINDMGIDRNITTTRLYRSISDQAGQGSYFFVAEFPVSQASYQDTITDDIVALNAQLVSLFWSGPPADLKGIVSFPNGMTVGFKSNEIWFSEAYRPHAWPPGYVITTEFPIVGLGVCGQAIVVCTQGTPYIVNGVNPSAMALTKINLPEPCLHRGSIVSTDTTVLYTSQNGLIQIAQSGAGSNITEGWVSRERWQELTPTQHMRAIKHATSYFAFGGEPLIRGFTVELSQQDQTSFTIWPQAGGHRLGFDILTSPNDFVIENVEVDPWTGVAILVQNSGIWYYDFTDMHPVIVPYRWRSKVYQQLSRKNFAACKVWFTVPDTTPPQTVRDVSFPQTTLAANQYGVVRVFADGVLYTTRELRKSGELLRIFSGEKVEEWQFEIEGRVNISNMQVATSVKELGLV